MKYSPLVLTAIVGCLLLCFGNSPAGISATTPPAPAEPSENIPLLDAAIYPEDGIFRIDYPIGIRLMLQNNSPEPVVLDRNVNFLKGFEINDMRLGAAKFDRQTEKLTPPLVIPPGGFIGVRLDLGRYFPGLRKPGNYKIRWSDPNLGVSTPLDIVVTDYVLMVTDYGDIAFKLLPQVAPGTVARFKQFAAKGFYEGSQIRGIKADRMVVVSPPSDSMSAFSETPAPLKPETTTEIITTGDVVVAGLFGLEGQGPGGSAVIPSFFVQLSPAASRENMKYTVFGRVFRGLDVLIAISHARHARNPQGQKLPSPARDISIKRVILIEEGKQVGASLSRVPEDAKPDVALSISPRTGKFTYGEPLNLRLAISNPYDKPLRLAPHLGIAAGMKIFKIEDPPPGGGGETLRRRMEISKDFPETYIPLSGGILGRKAVVGARRDITDICPAFAQGGKFEISWESGSIKTEPLIIEIQKSLFATITTDKGSFEIVLFEEAAPLAVGRFTQLARAGFYDGLTFYRVMNKNPLSLAQSGSPTGDETGQAEGEPVPLEASNRIFQAGTVGLAHTPADPDSGGSQYFIVTKIKPEGAAALFRRYTIIGQVKAARDEHGKPADFRTMLGKIAQDDKVIKIEISEKKPRWNNKEES